MSKNFITKSLGLFNFNNVFAEHAVKRTVPHFLKPAKRKLDEKGDQDKKVKVCVSL